jgi:hypothetical protein
VPIFADQGQWSCRPQELVVHGRWEHDTAAGGRVQHLIAGYLQDLTPMLGSLLTTSRDLGDGLQLASQSPMPKRAMATSRSLRTPTCFSCCTGSVPKLREKSQRKRIHRAAKVPQKFLAPVIKQQE